MLAVAWEVGVIRRNIARRSREEMQTIRDRLLLDLAFGRRIRVQLWADEHGIHWQRVYEWIQQIEASGVLAIVLTEQHEYVRLGHCEDSEVHA